MAIGHTGFLSFTYWKQNAIEMALLLHLVATCHYKELHVPCHLGIGVGHDVLLEGGVQPGEHSFYVSAGRGVVRVQVHQRLVQVSVLHLKLENFIF